MNSRNDLNFEEFESILKAKKEKIEKNIEMVKAEINALANEDEINDLADMAELQIDNVTDQKVIKQLKDEMFEIDEAIIRLRKGTYGICENTGKSIPQERLLASPSTRTIIDI